MSSSDLSVNVKVAVRARPLNPREKEQNSQVILKMIDGKLCQITKPGDAKPQEFTFDHAYDMDTTTEKVYEDLGVPILQRALEGYNATIFAYGQTGSGKTFNMMGNVINGGNITGIIPKMNDSLFEHIEHNKTKMQFLVSVSYLEIYQEVIHDLLNPSDKKLNIRENPATGIYVEGLAEIVVRSVEEIHALMEQGNKIRNVAATNMNQTSSRSHSVFTLKVLQKPMDENDGTKGLASKINLVDLAGSERANQTGATGERLKEGAAINKSLTMLGNVINALAEQGKKKGAAATHIPYRDSKLTRLLQESLGGNAITVMLAALSPASINYEETLSTIIYANRAKNIQNVSRKNEDENVRVVRELREEISKLRAMLQGGVSGEGGVDMDKMARMEAMIADLEYAKKQTWKEKEQISHQYEEERLANLQARGMMDLVMANLKNENLELQKKLASIEAEKEKLIKNFKTQKLRVSKLKASLEENIQQYNQLVEEGRQDDPEAKELEEKIRIKKQAIFEESDKLKEIKEALKANEESRVKGSEELRAQHIVLTEDSELRKAIQDEERERLAKENDLALQAEKKRLAEEMEKERERIRKELGGGSGLEKADAERLMDIEMKYIQEKNDKELLMKKVAILTSDNENLSNRLEEEHLRATVELEKQQVVHFQIFRKYREHFEDEKKRLEGRFVALLDEAIKDALYLSNRNAELEQQIAELKQGYGGGGGGGGRRY